MQLCDYGCGQEAKHPFKNGKWCCSYNTSLCPKMKQINSDKNKGRIISIEARKQQSKKLKGRKFTTSHKENLSKAHKGKKLSKEHKEKISKSNKGKTVSKEHRNKLRIARLGVEGYFKGKKLTKEHKRNISKGNKGKPVSEECKTKIRNTLKFSIKDYKTKHSFFSKIEEMRYNPDKPLEEKEIQVHCKNHNCKNSKEKGGWFTPIAYQLYDRIRSLESKNGSDGAYFYCSQECKDTCPLYKLRSDPYRNSELPYTYQENQLWRKIVLKEDKGLCQFCGNPATDVHHIKPVKTHPHLALDPDNGISFCEECHYKIGHKTGTECSTGNLANKQQQGCSLGSQK
jgi:hypothetical protein